MRQSGIEVVAQNGDQDVSESLLQDILIGALPAGTWLKQIDLEQRYGCSRPDIRRALDRLAQRRVILHVPNRGYRVYEIDEQQRQQIKDIRIILETSVVDLLIANVTPETIKELRLLAQRFDEMAFRGTILEHYDANIAFHQRLLELSGNSELVSLIAEIRQRTVSAPVSQWRIPARIEISGSEHHQMVDALEVGDADELRRLIRIHIQQTPPRA